MTVPEADLIPRPCARTWSTRVDRIPAAPARPALPRTADADRTADPTEPAGTWLFEPAYVAYVPYPVQVDGTELLMEWITDEDGGTAPRLAQTRPGPTLLASYFDQVRDAMRLLARQGWVHGDLSPYNLLAAGPRIVVIDLPQLVDLAGNAAAFDLLLRDCTNVCAWFARRGLDADADVLFADLLAEAL